MNQRHRCTAPLVDADLHDAIARRNKLTRIVTHMIRRESQRKDGTWFTETSGVMSQVARQSMAAMRTALAAGDHEAAALWLLKADTHKRWAAEFIDRAHIAERRQRTLQNRVATQRRRIDRLDREIEQFQSIATE